MKKRLLSMFLVLAMVLCLVPVTASAMEIKIDLTVVGQAELTLEVESGDLIGTVKDMITEKTGYPAYKQVLYYDGKELEDGWTLVDYDIYKGYTLVLQLKDCSAIQLLDSGTAANIGGGQADNIYFGTYKQSSDGNGGYNTDPIKWRVLSNADGKLFLLSDQNLDVFEYHKDVESVTWETSTMRSWLNGYNASSNTGGSNGMDYTNDNFLNTAFSAKEQTAIANTAVVNDDNPDYGTDGGNNTTDKIFLLSIAEARNSSYFPNGGSSHRSKNTAYVADGGKIGGSFMHGTGEAGVWWLRSPGGKPDGALTVSDVGDLNDHGTVVNSDRSAVRPAFNLNLNSVLFTSAAVGGKSASGMESGLTAVPEYTGNEWKLTLLDSSRNFVANASEGAEVMKKPGYSDWTVNIRYSGATTGDNEYVSAMLVDSNGEVLYYGCIAQNSANGEATVTIPNGLPAGAYTLKVFSEQRNGDLKTDYASAFKDVKLAVHDHAWSDNWSSDDSAHWHNCTEENCLITSNSKKDGYAEHSGGTATCTAKAVCKVCGEKYGDLAPHELTHIDAKTATCTETGNMEYWHCSVCEKNFTSEACDTEIADVETEKNASNHSGTAVWTQTTTTHKQVYSCCQVVNVAETNHTWQDGKCTVCNYPCTHSGGKAYCTAKAVCEICNQEYGNTDPSNHSGALEWVQTEKTHKQIYNCCQAVNVAEANHTWENGKCTVCNYVCQHTDTDKNHICDICGKTLSDHTGGKATCTKKAVCDYCGKEYGETDPNNHSGALEWTQTATTHEKKWNCCNAVVVASEPHEWENGKCSECGYACLHSGGKANCKDKAVCVVCNEEYGDLAPHELTHIDAKDATAAEFGNTEYWHCDVCDKYFSDENSTNEIALADTVISKLTPKIIAGDGATVTEGEKKALSFTSDAAFEDFLSVEVDGVALDEANYTVKSGSTVVTLNADYVATLAVGAHTLGIVSESGTATAKFTVNKKAEEVTSAETTTTPSNKAETTDLIKNSDKKSPQTGDGSNLALWFALLFISGGAVTLTTIASKKKKQENQ